MFHLLEFHICLNYMLGIFIQLIAQNEDLCLGVDGRHANIALSALQQGIH
jgi:hypothetical protein